MKKVLEKMPEYHEPLYPIVDGDGTVYLQDENGNTFFTMDESTYNNLVKYKAKKNEKDQELFSPKRNCY